MLRFMLVSSTGASLIVAGEDALGGVAMGEGELIGEYGDEARKEGVEGELDEDR